MARRQPIRDGLDGSGMQFDWGGEGLGILPQSALSPARPQAAQRRAGFAGGARAGGDMAESPGRAHPDP